jgi:hypothetical protein
MVKLQFLPCIGKTDAVKTEKRLKNAFLLGPLDRATVDWDCHGPHEAEVEDRPGEGSGHSEL